MNESTIGSALNLFHKIKQKIVLKNSSVTLFLEKVFIVYKIGRRVEVDLQSTIAGYLR